MAGAEPGPGGIGIGAGALPSSMRKPHVPQNRNDGGTSLPHDGQRRMPPAAAGVGPDGGPPIGAGPGAIGPPIGAGPLGGT